MKHFKWFDHLHTVQMDARQLADGKEYYAVWFTRGVVRYFKPDGSPYGAEVAQMPGDVYDVDACGLPEQMPEQVPEQKPEQVRRQLRQNGAGYKLVETDARGGRTVTARLDPVGECWRVLLYDRQSRQWVQPAAGAHLPTLVAAKRFLFT